MADWRNRPLGEVITLHRGFDLPSRVRLEGPIPVVSSSGVTGWHRSARISPPGVVTGRYGTLGRVFYVDEPFWPLNTTLYVSEFNGNDPRFVAYFLEGMDLARYDGAAAVPGLDRNVLHRIQVKWPDGPTQAKIATVLAAYDELIENNLRRIEILEELVATVYRQWFVDRGGPAHRGDADADGLVAGTWAHQSLDHLVNVYRGRSYSTSNLVDAGGHAFLNLKCIDRDGGFRRHGLKRYDGPYRASQLARTGDILVAVTDMTQERRIVARAARVPRLPEPESVFSADLVRLVPFDPADGPFVYATLRFSMFPERVKQYANGANVLHLNPARIAEYELAVPPRQLRLSFGELLAPLLGFSDVLELQVETLRAIRRLLLPRLVSGEVDVAGLDIDMEWITA